MKQSLTIVQWTNPRFCGKESEREENNSPYGYTVDKVTNLLKPNVGEVLWPSQVQALIDSDVVVNIIAPKGN
jgi:hypothetical protein